MPTTVTGEDVLRVLRECGSLSAIDVTRELINRGQCANRYAIGASDCVRYVLTRLVRSGAVQVQSCRKNRRGFANQKVYAIIEEPAA